MAGWLVITAALAWWGWGFAGFVYWWTTSWTMKAEDVRFGLVVGLMGPPTWLLGWRLHRDTRRPPWPPNR